MVRAYSEKTPPGRELFRPTALSRLHLILKVQGKQKHFRARPYRQGELLRRNSAPARRPKIGSNKKSPSGRGILVGAPEEIRTPGLLIRSQTLYPAELRAHTRYCIALRRKLGEEGGIRTLDTLRYTPLAGVRFQPLTHLSRLSCSGAWVLDPQTVARGEGFEPPVGCPTTVFKTVAFNHSANPPCGGCVLRLFLSGAVSSAKGSIRSIPHLVNAGTCGQPTSTPAGPARRGAARPTTGSAARPPGASAALPGPPRGGCAAERAR